MPYVLKALEEGPAEYRFAALQSLGKGDDKLFAQVAAGMPRYDAAAQAAVIIFISRVLNLILYRDCKSLPKNVFFGMV